MFSVNNFYDFFSSYYGWKKTKTIPWVFRTHGSKNLLELKPYYDEKEYIDNQYVWPMHGTIILHDQEPFSINAVDTYRNNLLDQEKTNLYAPLNKKELLLSITLSSSWPIFCHSEYNSMDIKYVRHMGFIDCHYFWHGLVARDWFRHWKHHGDLTQSKSWHKRFLLYAREHTGSRQYRKSLIESLMPMQNQIQYDWQGDNVVDSSYSAKIVVKDAVDTAIHIVAETVFDQNKIHLTEKIFKPIVMRQPFVVFAGAGSLAYLKKYGFKTFDSVWDESYDQETDHETRSNKILKLIANLYNQSEEQFKRIIEQCNGIVEHNLDHFFSNRFEEILLKELHQNVTHSIDVQNQKQLQDPGGSLFSALNLIHDRKGQLNPGMEQYFKRIALHIKQAQPQRYQQICKKYSWAVNYCE